VAERAFGIWGAKLEKKKIIIIIGGAKPEK
jgi:hypothetical protein